MTPQQQINDYIAGLGDWRGEALSGIRKAILAADPEIIEEWKWMGSPVWERFGLLLVGNAHKTKIKLTFAHGASLPDPDGLFNGKDAGQTRRSIDVFEGDTLDKGALTALVQAAISYNLTHLKKNAGKGTKSPARKSD